MSAYFVTLALGAVAVTVFLAFRVKKKMVKAVITKAAAGVLFILTALAAAYTVICENIASGDFERIGEYFPYIFFLIGGLLCGLLGVIWLDLKFCHSAEDRPYTYAGFTCFGVGHVLFFAALASLYGIKLKALLLSAAVAAVVALGIIFGEKLMKLHYGEFKAISVLYCFLMVFATVYALNICIFSEGGIPKTALTVNIGGVFFIISDFILSGTYFGEGKNRTVDIVSNHVTYYIAQYVIASSILFL